MVFFLYKIVLARDGNLYISFESKLETVFVFCEVCVRLCLFSTHNELFSLGQVSSISGRQVGFFICRFSFLTYYAHMLLLIQVL